MQRRLRDSAEGAKRLCLDGFSWRARVRWQLSACRWSISFPERHTALQEYCAEQILCYTLPSQHVCPPSFLCRITLFLIEFLSLSSNETVMDLPCASPVRLPITPLPPLDSHRPQSQELLSTHGLLSAGPRKQSEAVHP